MSGRIFEVDESSSTAAPPPVAPQESASPKAPRRKPSIRAVVIGTILVLAIVIGIAAVIMAFRFYRRAVSYVQAVQATASMTGTKLDALGARTSVVVIKGYTQSSRVSNKFGTVNLEPIEVKDLQTGERALGVQIHIKPSGIVSVTQDGSIDYDELDSLIRAIDYMSAASHKAASFDRFQAQYVTRGLVRFALFDDDKGTNQAMLNAGVIPTGNQFLNMEELATIRKGLVDSKAKLDLIR